MECHFKEMTSISLRFSYYKEVLLIDSNMHKLESKA